MKRYRRNAVVLSAYAVVAAVFAWPLPRHLATHLTGSPDGDTGVYLWNQWVFHHEIVARHSVPYFTDMIFAMSGRANLSLHNYTTLANVVAFPLIGPLGLIAAFNLTYLLMGVLSAYAMFLLVREVTKSDGVEAWLAGVLFAWSPMLVTRSAGHFSLVAAAALPLFVLVLLRIHRNPCARTSLLLGALVALAMWSDVYYAVYCLMLAAGYVCVQLVDVSRNPPGAVRHTRVLHAIDTLAVCVGGLVLAIALTRGWQFTVLGRVVGMRRLYTPVLVLTVLLVVRLCWSYRPALTHVGPAVLRTATRLTISAGLMATVLLSPVLYALGVRIRDGSFVSTPVFWRSSPDGVDLLAFLVPNPNHPLAPAAFGTWLAQPMAALEHVASIPLVVFLAIAAAWRMGWRLPRLWMALGAGAVLIALGPFIHVAGVNTYVPGPWALLRYLPIVGLARTPARFTVVVMLLVAVSFAKALRAIRTRRGPTAVWGFGLLLLFELWPAPRTLSSAYMPTIYATIAADPRVDVKVLELPFGISSGVFSVGRYTYGQFHQTVHQKPIFDGTLSRISRRRVDAIRRFPILDALIRLSEGQRIPPEQMPALETLGRKFIVRANLGYVAIDRARASPELVAFATKVLNLRHVSSDGSYELYAPFRD